MTKFSGSVVVLFLASLAAFAFVHLDHSRRDESASASTMAAMPNAPSRPDVGVVGTDRDTEPVTQADARSSAQWRQDHARGASLRTFMAQALQHPESGGYFYVRQVLRECRLLAAQVENASTADPGDLARQDAAERIQRRCGELVPAEYSDSSLADLTARARVNGDKLIAAHDRILEALRVNDRKAAVDALLADPDPLLVQEFAERLLVAEEAGRVVYRFNGKTYPVSADPPIGYAIQLLPCGLGLDCGSSDPLTLLRCTSGQGCDGGRVAYIERLLAADPDRRTAALGLFKELTASIRSGRLEH